MYIKQQQSDPVKDTLFISISNIATIQALTLPAEKKTQLQYK